MSDQIPVSSDDQIVIPASSSPAPIASSGDLPQPKKSPMHLILLMLFVFVVLVLAGAGYYYFVMQKSSSSDAPRSSYPLLDTSESSVPDQGFGYGTDQTVEPTMTSTDEVTDIQKDIESTVIEQESTAEFDTDLNTL